MRKPRNEGGINAIKTRSTMVSFFMRGPIRAELKIEAVTKLKELIGDSGKECCTNVTCERRRTAEARNHSNYN
jgi:hypothetical protein